MEFQKVENWRCKVINPMSFMVFSSFPFPGTPGSKSKRDSLIPTEAELIVRRSTRFKKKDILFNSARKLRENLH